MSDELSDHDEAAIRSIGLGPDNAGRTFKVGQKWKDEVGGVVTITTLTGAIDTFPMEATNQDGKTRHYTSEGRYFDDRGSVYDLTILVADVDDTPMKPEPVKTMRDEIAIAAMQALIPIHHALGLSFAVTVDDAYRLADAMLRAKEAK